MKGFWRSRGWPAALAILLAAAGAAGLGPWLGDAARVVHVIDVSPSGQPPAEIPADALTLTDSDLGAGLRRAAADRPDRIVLASDGVDRSGTVPALPPDIPIDVVLLDRRDDVGILEVRIPGRIPPDSRFAVDVVVGRTAGPGSESVEVGVALTRDGERVGGLATVRLKRGQTRTVRIPDRVAREGLVRYQARLNGATGATGNDRAGAVARIGERPLVLAIGKAPDLGAGARVVVKRPEEVSAFLADPAVGARLDAVLLDGPLPSGQAELAAAVRGGAGLVVLGGVGFAGHPLEQVLPLTDAPPEGRAAVLLLDFSGSMHRLKEKLLVAVERLREHFAPDDRIACVVFRDRVVYSSGWSAARSADWDLAERPHGQTFLVPALREAQRLLRTVGKARRRVFVVSDGAWLDDSGELVATLAELKTEGIFRAALFVEEMVEAPFDKSLLATDDFVASLKQLEESAPDRFVRDEVAASASRGPRWLEDAVPPAGAYRDFARLWTRNEGEQVVLQAGEIPLVGAWRRGGKVVVCAPRVDPAPLVRACLREGGDVTVRARRANGMIEIEVSGGTGSESVTVGGERVALRPAGRQRARGRVVAPAGEVLVACGPAIALVPAASAPELTGLTNRRDIAAAIAARSGGKLYAGMPSDDTTGATPAFYLTLLAAAALVVVSALLRRKP